jgi:hypothetical protein
VNRRPVLLAIRLFLRTRVAPLVLILGATAFADAGAQRATTAATSPATKAPAPAKPDTGLTMGSFVSSRIDGKRLPVVDLATDSLGTQYVVEFTELVLAVKAGGEFRASLRYRQTLALKGRAITQEPLQRMTVYGSWVRDGQSIRFVPDPKRGGEGLRILAGTVTLRTITVPFDYQNGRVTKRSTVLLVYDPTIF